MATSEVYAGTFGELSVFNFDTFKAPSGTGVLGNKSEEDSEVFKSLPAFGPIRQATPQVAEGPKLTESQKLRPLVPLR